MAATTEKISFYSCHEKADNYDGFVYDTISGHHIDSEDITRIKSRQMRQSLMDGSLLVMLVDGLM